MQRKLQAVPLNRLPFKPMPWAIYPIAQHSRITMIAGEPGTGKSMFALGCILANYARKEFLNFPLRERCRVLYIGMDAPTDDYGSQIRRLSRSLNLEAMSLDEGLDPTDDREPPCLMFSDSKLNLAELALELETFFKTGIYSDEGEEYFYPVDVLIIDALRQAHDGDENDTRQMGLVMSILRKIAERGTAVVLLHHTAKAAATFSAVYAARGSTTIAGSVDIMINLSVAKKGERSQFGGWNGVKAEVTKGRGWDLPGKFFFNNTYDAERIELKVVDEKELKEKESASVIDKLSTLSGAWTWSDLLKETKVSTTLLKAALADAGWIKDGSSWMPGIREVAEPVAK